MKKKFDLDKFIYTVEMAGLQLIVIGFGSVLVLMGVTFLSNPIISKFASVCMILAGIPVTLMFPILWIVEQVRTSRNKHIILV